MWSPCTQDPDPCGRVETHNPPDLHLGDMVRIGSLLVGPLRWKQVGSCQPWDGRKREGGLLSRTVPEKSSSFPFGSTYVILTVLHSCHDNVEHITLVLAEAWSFPVPQVKSTWVQRLEARGRVWSH